MKNRSKISASRPSFNRNTSYKNNKLFKNIFTKNRRKKT